MTEQTRIPTNLRLLRIIEAFGNTDRPLTPTEINRHLGLPKQSIHRLCRLLVDEGYLAADTEGRRLQPGRRMLKLSSGVLQASHLHIARHQVLRAAAQAIG
ncbi:MAG: helix-turn-helix domain-containing protein, partial [Alphaproteobacteria bacterium]